MIENWIGKARQRHTNSYDTVQYNTIQYNTIQYKTRQTETNHIRYNTISQCHIIYDYIKDSYGEKLKDYFNNMCGKRVEIDESKSQKSKKVKCSECGWSWKLSEGGHDPYTCHKCGNINSKSELTEKCWPGYTQKGMKTMFGKRYPNCVKKTKK